MISTVILNPERSRGMKDPIISQILHSPQNDDTVLLKEILFPKFCLGCGRFGKYICSTCRRQLVLLESRCCFYCARTSYMGLTHPQCARQDGIDGFISIFKYNNLLKKIIKTIKYRLASDVLEEVVLGADYKITDDLSFFLSADTPLLFQPIPLHKLRLKVRGFNQAQLIIKKLQRSVDISSCDFLVRIKNTSPQAQIADKSKRLVNVQGAFDISGEARSLIVNKAFFLVDDVVTTGSTVREAARILKIHKAAKVYVFSLAKG